MRSVSGLCTFVCDDKLISMDTVLVKSAVEKRTAG